VEVTLSIECEIPTLKLSIELLPNMAVEEEHVFFLEHLDEHHKDVGNCEQGT
jgi:hypothetical protein